MAFNKNTIAGSALWNGIEPHYIKKEKTASGDKTYICRFQQPVPAQKTLQGWSTEILKEEFWQILLIEQVISGETEEIFYKYPFGSKQFKFSPNKLHDYNFIHSI